MIKKVIAVFGGSFDPPTMAHALIISEILNKNLADEVLLVPCGDRTDKNLQLGKHRLNLVDLMIKNVFPEKSPITVSSIEIDNGYMIPTYNLMKQLRLIYNDYELHFVIGSDLVKDLRSWNNGDDLIKENGFIILNRPGTKEIDKSLLPPKFQLLEEFNIDVSSTEVRKRIKNNTSQNLGVLGLVSKDVLLYIIEHKLYQ